MPLGAVSCWVFLSALEVLQTCERFNDSSHVEAYSLYTAGLWAYTRDKVCFSFKIIRILFTGDICNFSFFNFSYKSLARCVA